MLENTILFEKSSEAIPCPFCGGSEIIIEKYKHGCGGERFRIFCASCLAGIDPGWAQTKGTVEQMWNRRENQ